MTIEARAAFAVQVVEHFLVRIEEFDLHVHAFRRVDAQALLADQSA